MDINEIISTYAPAAGLAPVVCKADMGGGFVGLLGRNPYLMAPMAGVSDAAWRIMSRLGGCALAYSEMVSATGLHYKSDKTWELVEPSAAEPDIVVQLFGAEPAYFSEAVRTIEAGLGDKLAAFDINMACPVPKVVKKGEGSALLETPGLAARLVEATVAAAHVPVSVKIRLGMTAEHIVAPSFAKTMQEAGACAVAVHGRTRGQMYRGRSDRAAVAEVVRAVEVPVIASGDVLDARAANDVLRETGAAGVFVARGSYGNPWLAADATALSEGVVREHPFAERMAAFKLHVMLLEATGAHIARARNLSGWYFKGIPDAAAWRFRAMECDAAEQYLALADEAVALYG